MNLTSNSTAQRSNFLFFFGIFLSCAILLLILAGGLVTSHEAGLAVPDWPLSYGQMMPPMVGNIFWEHGHRMIAGTVGFLTLILAIWIQMKENRGWMKRLGRRWTNLHRLIYPAAALVIIHFIWLVKSDYREPLLFGLGVAALLFLRRPAVRRYISNLRFQVSQPGKEPASTPDEVKSLP